MSSPTKPLSDHPPAAPSDSYTLFFTLTLCAVCSIILAALASGLKDDQARAVELERNKQLLVASHLMSHEGVFQMQNASGQWQAASLNQQGQLVASERALPATNEQIHQLFEKRIVAMFTNDKGQLQSPQELKINVERFFQEHQKLGFAQLPHKLVYVILSEGSKDPKKDPIAGYILPVNGFGLWGPIYGYLAIDQDAKTVLGISWYQQGETPGLGANIAEASWQSQFPGKSIFQKDRSGNVDYAKSPIGIVVIKGKVKEVLGEDPRSESAVDGMSGATITGNGVSRAYKDILEQYRPFLLQQMKMSEASPKRGKR